MRCSPYVPLGQSSASATIDSFIDMSMSEKLTAQDIYMHLVAIIISKSLRIENVMKYIHEKP